MRTDGAVVRLAGLGLTVHGLLTSRGLAEAFAFAGRGPVVMTHEGPVSRRQALSAAATGVLGLTVAAGGAWAESPPRSIAPCPMEGNCISTASFKQLETGKYMAPWGYDDDTSDPKQAFSKLVAAIDQDPQLRLAEKDEGALYVRAEAVSAVPPDGIDDLEFLIKPGDGLVTYSSRSRKVVRAGPVVVGDGGSIKNRLETLRRSLGWSERGLSDYYGGEGGYPANAGYLKSFNLKGARSSYGEEDDY